MPRSSRFDWTVCLLEGGGRLNRRVQRRVRQAAQSMADAGVRYAAAPPEWAALLLPLRLPAPVALRRAMLGQLVDCACRQLGLCRSQASLVLAVAPGPDNLFVLAQSAVYGVRAGLTVVLGLCTGLVVQTICAACGVAAVVAAVPALYAYSGSGQARLTDLLWHGHDADIDGQRAGRAL